MAVITASDFDKVISHMPFLDSDVIQEARAAARESGDDTVDQFLAELVTRGALTRFQANSLADGKGRALTIAGRYYLCNKANASTFGSRYVCRELGADRDLIAAVMPTNRLSGAGGLQVLEATARRWTAVDHPGVVKSRDFCAANHLRVLIQDVPRGTPLDQVVTPDSPAGVAAAVHVIKQAADALDALHGHGLTHGDLKPANILLDGERNARLVNTGMTVVFPFTFDDGVQDTQFLTKKDVRSTLDFAAPETAFGEDRDIRSDIYSLGGVLFYMLTGRPIFQAPNLAGLAMAIYSHEPEPLDQARQGVSRALAEVFARMTHKDPGGRYQTPRELLDDLESVDARAAAPRRATPRPASAPTVRTPAPQEEQQAEGASVPGWAVALGLAAATAGVAAALVGLLG